MSALAIDVGTTTVKAVGYDDGREVRVARAPATVRRPHPGWAEQDMNQVWNATVHCIREVLAHLASPPQFLSVTAQGDGAWMVDADGRAVGPAVLWNDARASATLQAWDHDGVVGEAFEICGSRLSTGMPNAILDWMRRHDPDRVAAADRLLSCGGWIFLRLTGETVMDESDAAAPYLDLRERTWSQRLLTLYDQVWAWELLPELCDDEHRTAAIRDQLAEELGLPTGTPVVLAPYDICATALGVDAGRVGAASCILGTTICTQSVADEVVTTTPVGITIPLGVPDRYVRAFPTLSGGDALDWGARLLGVGGPADLFELAERGRRGTAGVRFLPYLSPGGERAPFFDPTARGSLTGLSLDADRHDVARAVVEGVTLTVTNSLRSLPGDPERLSLCGGGAGNRFWAQLIADMTGLQVTLPDDAEVGARGAWLTGMVSLGLETSIDVAASTYVVAGATLDPDPDRAAEAADRYAEFTALRDMSRPLWQASVSARSDAGGTS